MTRPLTSLTQQVFIALAVFVVFTPPSLADIPQVINYQGKLTYGTGEPVPDGDYTVQFRIYDDATTGNLLWDSGAMSVAVNGGIFEALLGESPQPAIDLSFDRDLWLQVTVHGDDQLPRKRLGSVGYAFMASGLVPETTIDGSTTGIVLEVFNGDAGTAVQGWTSATSGLGIGVEGVCNAVDGGKGVLGTATTTLGGAYGVYGTTASTSGSGVFGEATSLVGNAYGVYGRSSSSEGSGVYGIFGSTTSSGVGVMGELYSSQGVAVKAYVPIMVGATHGVYAVNWSSEGTGVEGYVNNNWGTTYGVLGKASSTRGRGVVGDATALTGHVWGVWGRTQADSGRAVYGYAYATTGPNYGVMGLNESNEGTAVFGGANAADGTTYGVFGYSSSTSGCGVCGRAYASEGSAWGVSGRTHSTSGRGVYGFAQATSGFADGVVGLTESIEGSGVLGGANANSGSTKGVYGYSSSPSGHGVFGRAQATTGVNYGVYGTTYSAAGYAGYFDGSTYVNGWFGKGSGSFVIDHPLDPANKLLTHNFVESPENLLIYRGTIRLDSRGEADVTLPDYFNALTDEGHASIHLTPRGKPFLSGYDWQTDYSGFTVYGESNREVAWMLLADRDDPVIHQLARPIEEDKGPDNKLCDRGEFLYPTAYGYPESMGRGYRHRDQAEADTRLLSQDPEEDARLEDRYRHLQGEHERTLRELEERQKE